MNCNKQHTRRHNREGTHCVKGAESQKSAHTAPLYLTPKRLPAKHHHPSLTCNAGRQPHKYIQNTLLLLFNTDTYTYPPLRRAWLTCCSRQPCAPELPGTCRGHLTGLCANIGGSKQHDNDTAQHSTAHDGGCESCSFLAERHVQICKWSGQRTGSHSAQTQNKYSLPPLSPKSIPATLSGSSCASSCTSRGAPSGLQRHNRLRLSCCIVWVTHMLLH